MTSPTKTARSARALTPEQRRQFETDGVVAIPSVIDRAAIDAMADRLWTALEKQSGIRRDRRETWAVERPAQLQSLRHAGAFDAMLCPAVEALIDDLFGAGRWTRPKTWGQPLVTFPAATEPWDVPSTAWHLDLPPGQHAALEPQYLRVFTFLAPMRPGGGGTVYLAGSHRVVAGRAAAAGAKLRSADMRELLKAEEPALADLWSASPQPDRIRQFMDEGVTVRGVRLRVMEMLGEPGDVVLMHPCTFHTPAPNRRDTPRLMVVDGVMKAGG